MDHMSFVLILSAVSTIVPVIPPVSTPVSPPASAPACATYAIDGALQPPAQGEWEFTATAYLHDGSESLANHRVYAVPVMATGMPPAEPIELVTDVDGRASLTLPVGAEGVRFMSESPDGADCQGPPAVVAVDVSTPVGSEFGPDVAGSGPGLPVTGVPGWLITLAAFPAAAGIGIVIGRGRRPRPATSRPAG